MTPLQAASPPQNLLVVTMRQLNQFIFRNIRVIEMIGVIMRIVSFSLVSWMGPNSPFMFVWIFNTIDAAMLAWCSALRKDPAYTLLNSFWILVGIVGILRASQVIH
ncbi:hypothetical protein [Parachitinimonas caeni]|uniref:CBU-0592-like domain-containing protein n=1 Tax=Parachitinimonas caeni TaxID=3031301 RepID=A0ABT7E1Y0_9NEIS|nr:hypothetical protein [Parachitinimonas caeni]MDK2124917.1 hypothetical protein [Parachitinimonas caeni]